MPSMERQEEYNGQADAWNNISAFLKFLILEEYIKTNTANDIIASLNKLGPQEPKEEKELSNASIYDAEPKEQIGFVNQQDMLIREITDKIMQLFVTFSEEKYSINDENDFAILKKNAITLLEQYINAEIPGEQV